MKESEDERSVTGIVLAGGKSSRMGTDKSLMLLDGKPMIQHAIDAIAPLCSQVVISAGKDVYGFTGCEVWPDELPDHAPMIGIYTCLKRSRTDLNIILSCDMPLVTTPLFHYLLSQSSTADATIASHDNELWEPLCGIYRKSAIPSLEKFISNHHFKLHDFLQSIVINAMDINESLDFYSAQLFRNINTISDFNALSIKANPNH